MAMITHPLQLARKLIQMWYQCLDQVAVMEDTAPTDLHDSCLLEKSVTDGVGLGYEIDDKMKSKLSFRPSLCFITQ